MNFVMEIQTGHGMVCMVVRCVVDEELTNATLTIVIRFVFIFSTFFFERKKYRFSFFFFSISLNGPLSHFLFISYIAIFLVRTLVYMFAVCLHAQSTAMPGHTINGNNKSNKTIVYVSFWAKQWNTNNSIIYQSPVARAGSDSSNSDSSSLNSFSSNSC